MRPAVRFHVGGLAHALDGHRAASPTRAEDLPVDDEERRHQHRPDPEDGSPWELSASPSHHRHSDDPELPGAQPERDPAEDGGHEADDGESDNG